MSKPQIIMESHDNLRFSFDYELLEAYFSKVAKSTRLDYFLATRAVASPLEVLTLTMYNPTGNALISNVLFVS